MNINKNLEVFLDKEERAIKVIYVSSYIPRKCGIATYTKDLTNDINQLNPFALAEIMALTKNGESIVYPWEVKFRINQDELSSFLNAADYINQSGSNIVCLQHEYGLFGGHCGEYILPFIEAIQKPIVTTFHTVIKEPSSDQGNVLKRILSRSDASVVMMKETKKRLVNDFKIPNEKVVSIPHGTPDLAFESTTPHKRKKRLSNKIVLGNINLLSSVKGIEYALEATAIIAKKIPDVLYLVIGQTHPATIKHEGEIYRNHLKKLVKKLKIENNVRFINEYLTLEDLLSWLKTIDYYITPYLDPQQSSSGALAYAIGAGKVCISTPYLYAQEALSLNRGILVPFKNSQLIASAVLELNSDLNKKREIENKAYAYGRLMTWSNVALKYLNLFRAVLNQHE